MTVMLRRPYLDDPKSRLAVWSGRMALFALVTTVLSIVIVRSGMLEAQPALVTFAAALMLAALAVLLALASFVVIWREGLTGLGRAVAGMMLGLALLAYPAYLGYRATKLPAISDVTTDTANPPRFDVLARLRPRGTSTYPGAKTAQLQEEAYPDIVPLQSETSAAVSYRVAQAVIAKRKWLVVDAQAPGPRRDGTIEAVARTTIMGFRDDVVVRVSTVGTGSRIDIRSASRVGAHDFGSNAARVTALLTDIDDALSAAPPELRAPERKPPPPARPPAQKPPQPPRR